MLMLGLLSRGHNNIHKFLASFISLQGFLETYVLFTI